MINSKIYYLADVRKENRRTNKPGRPDAGQKYFLHASISKFHHQSISVHNLHNLQSQVKSQVSESRNHARIGQRNKDAKVYLCCVRLVANWNSGCIGSFVVLPQPQLLLLGHSEKKKLSPYFFSRGSMPQQNVLFQCLPKFVLTFLLLAVCPLLARPRPCSSQRIERILLSEATRRCSHSAVQK